MKKITLNGKWYQRPLLFRFFTILCSVTMLFTSNTVNSQTPTSCGNVNCTSNDVRVVSAYLSGPGNTPIDCGATDPFFNAELHLIVSSNTQRIGVSISGSLDVGTTHTLFANCFTGTTLNNGGNNNLFLPISLTGIQCAPPGGFSLSNLFISWGTGNTDFCDGSNAGHCPATPAKCRFKPGEVIIVDVKLDVDFGFVAGVCANGGNSLAFDFTPTILAKNIVYPLAYHWDFGDPASGAGNTADFSQVTSSDPVPGAQHTFSGVGTYTVTLTVTDATTGTPYTKSSVHTIMPVACCNLSAPILTVVDKCGGISTITAKDADGNIISSGLTWSNGATGNPIDVTTTTAVTATVTIGDCVSGSSNSVTPAPKATPPAPILTVVDKCGSISTITAKDADGNIISSGLTWSNGATGNPIDVTTTTAVTATVTIGDCVSSSSNSVTPAPKATPPAPILTVVDKCGGISTITAKDADGNIISSGLTWSNGATGNPIDVTTTTAVTATVTIGDCVSSSSNSVTPAPKTTPPAPILSVVDKCGGISTITAKDGDGNIISSGLTWSNGATGNPIDVTTTTAVTATVTIGDCVSGSSNSVTPAPKATPPAPTVGVVNNCNGTSTLTVTGLVDVSTITWSDDATNHSNPRTVSSAGTYKVTQTLNGCTSAEGSGYAAPKSTPVAAITVGTQNCAGGVASFTLTAGSVPPNTTLTWSKPATADGSLSTTSGSSTVYTPGVNDKKNGVVITLVAALYGCSSSTTATLKTAPCGPFYTYTQGYYSSTGTSCTPKGGVKGAVALVQYAIDNMDGTMGNSAGQFTLGTAGHSFTANWADASKLVAIMPGGGTPDKLAANYNLTTTANYPPLKNGKIVNVLLSQAITLKLNINIQGDGLKGFILSAGYLTTQKGDLSKCPAVAVVPCSKDKSAISSLKITTNTTLMTLLNGKTVDDLLNMASAALGGTLPPGVTYSDINNAVDVINKSFDGGRFVLGYYAAPQSCSTLPTARSAENFVTAPEELRSAVANLTVTAYPNPFTDRVKFSMVSPVSGKASLDVYNMMGQKIHNVYTGYLFANQAQMVDYNVPSGSKGSLIYTLKVGDKQINGKVIQLK